VTIWSICILRSSALHELENEHISHNAIILAVCVPKIGKFGEDLAKFWQKQVELPCCSPSQASHDSGKSHALMHDRWLNICCYRYCFYTHLFGSTFVDGADVKLQHRCAACEWTIKIYTFLHVSVCLLVHSCDMATSWCLPLPQPSTDPEPNERETRGFHCMVGSLFFVTKIRVAGLNEDVKTGVLLLAHLA